MAIFTGMTMGVLTPLVSDITATGLSLVGDVTAEELELAETDAILRGPVSVSLDLMKADDMAMLRGAFIRIVFSSFLKRPASAWP